MKNKKIQFHPQLGIFPQLQKRYASVIVVSVLLIVLSFRYLSSVAVLLYTVFFATIILVMVLLYSNFRWQSIWKKLRPYVVTRALYVIALGFYISNLYITVPVAIEKNAVGPYMIYWVLLTVLIYQFFDIFSFAGKAKTQNPSRCDFC